MTRWLAGSLGWSRVLPILASIRSHLRSSSYETPHFSYHIYLTPNVCFLNLSPSSHSCLTRQQKSIRCLVSVEWASVLLSRHSLIRRKRRWRTWKSSPLSLFEIYFASANKFLYLISKLRAEIDLNLQPNF